MTAQGPAGHPLKTRKSPVCRHLLPTDRLADIGCGDGEATVQYAARVQNCIGIERSDNLRRKAQEAVMKSGLSNISVRSGDIMDFGTIEGEFDVVVTQRVLINLSSWEDQKRALLNVHRVLNPGGRYIMIENTNDAFLALNDMRTAMGLPPIPQHWHNRFFDYDNLMAFCQGRFQLLKHFDFGLYYLLTRVYVPMFASFEGYGANAVKDPMFDKSDAAARLLFERFGDRVRVAGSRAFGPIQVFVLRREGHDTVSLG